MTLNEALQGALVDLLRADTALAALVGDNVFDEVPADGAGVAPPYVYLGPINLARVETCGPAWTVRMRWFAESADYGRLEAWQVAEAVMDAIEDAEPALPDPWSVAEPIRVTQAGDVIDPLNPKTVFVDLTTTVTKPPA